MRAQVPPLASSIAPDGFAVAQAFSQTLQPHLVRAVLPAGPFLVFASGDRLFLTRPNAPTHRHEIIDLRQDIAFLARGPQGNVLVGHLAGFISELDGTTYRAVAMRPGVANTFDVVVLPNGDLLANANPLWQTNGNAGIWHVPVADAPRELLPLDGPSGPLTLMPNGDLIVAELGPVVPPPPGTARLLRIPAVRVQAALAGQTLDMTDVSEIGGGYDGIYDLVADGSGRLLSTNPSTGRITASIVNGLAADTTWMDFGTTRFATHLTLHEPNGGTFLGYQPNERAPELLVTTTDYTSWLEVVRTGPQRPSLAPTTPTPHAPGPVTLALQDAPPLGVALWFASLQPTGNEFAAISFDGAPIWLALPPTDAVFVGSSTIDAAGQSSWSFVNPGIDHRIDWQAFAWSPSATCSSSPTFTQLQP